MTRDDLKEVIGRVIKVLGTSPGAACIFGDNPCDTTLKYGIFPPPPPPDPCDVTTRYAIGEET